MQHSFPHVHHGNALEWRRRLTLAHGIGWLAEAETHGAMQAALRELFAEQEFPTEITSGELWYERDWLGKPFVSWRGSVGAWAEERGLNLKHLHVSNTHDGGAQIVIAAYHPELVGIGIDAVYMPRLMQPGKGEEYMRRFAARFMSAREKKAFLQASEGENLDELRLRTAAHFSLMEAGSKALGTGLKIGVGMGRETSLPKQSIGVLRLEPDVEMLFESEAQVQLNVLGASRAEAYWGANAEFLVSAVLLWR